MAVKIPTCLFLPGDSLKMLRETLCVAQTAVALPPLSESNRTKEHIDRLQRMINEIDRQRPLDSAGKHGKLHTLLCGCERGKARAV